MPRAKSKKSPRKGGSKKRRPMPKSAMPTKKHRRDPRRMIKDEVVLDNRDESQYVYGKNAVTEVLRREPKRVQKIYVGKETSGDKRISLIYKLARENNVTLQPVPDAKLTALVDVDVRHKAELVHQNVIALVSPVPLLDLDDWIEDIADSVQESQKGLVVALDEVTDPHNIGAIIRVAESMGALGVMLPKHRSGVVSPVASKAASGADRIIPLIQVTNLSQSLEKLKEIGFWVLGSALEEDTPVFSQLNYRDMPTVLVMGSEGKGLRPGVKGVCDMLGYIPMYGETQSLNVATATAIMAYEIAMQQHESDE